MRKKKTRPKPEAINGIMSKVILLMTMAIDAEILAVEAVGAAQEYARPHV